jgi:hypothetical protein
LTDEETTDESVEQTSGDGEQQPSENNNNQGKDDHTKETEKLRLKDWLALFIAALQTVMLPLVLLLGILFVLTIIVSIFF